MHKCKIGPVKDLLCKKNQQEKISKSYLEHPGPERGIETDEYNHFIIIKEQSRASYIFISPLAKFKHPLSSRDFSPSVEARQVGLNSCNSTVLRVRQQIVMDFTMPDWHTDNSPRGFWCFQQKGDTLQQQYSLT